MTAKINKEETNPMRNLKKFLALVMAMVMSFSLMLTANAASKYDQVKEWTDKDQVTEEFIKAVDVLSGMKVYQGDENGFRPGSNITRAEVAALIYRLSTGDTGNEKKDLYTTVHPFVDVKADDWFAGYVGYCWNAGYIKGTTATTFNPYANVTGYEVLAMVLRAMGYDQNNEFTGSQWILRVSSTATQRELLNDVKSAHYDATLHLASRRDVVASILFHAAQAATVEYTPAFGYQTTHYSGSATTGEQRVENESLGEKYFGLKKSTGIIVGNQDTGESGTRVNWNLTGKPAYYSYFHQTRNFDESLATPGVGTTTETVSIDAKTGVDMFGHKVEIWYNNDDTGNKTTYALYDNVVKTALVTVSDPAADGKVALSDSTYTAAAKATKALLGQAAQAAGFNVDLKRSKAVFNQDFGVSGSIARINTTTEAVGSSDYVSNGAFATVGSGHDANGVVSANKLGEDSNTDYPLYLLISNSSNNQVDMVVALSTNVSRVAQVNSHASYPTVTVPQFAAANDTWNDQALDMIHQTALTATSTKTLGEPVVGVAIIGTNTPDVKTVCSATAGTPEATGFTPPATTTVDGGDTANLFYRLSKPTSVVEGTVTNFNYTQANHTGSIVIGGQRIERSLLADDIADYDADPTAANRGIQGNKPAVNLSATAQLYGNYRAYLDADGKYIWIEPIYNSEFVYGTYLDYTTPYGSSTYEYTLVGVNLKGEQVKKVVKTLDGKPIANVSTQANVVTMADTGLPFRDSANGVSGVTKQSYVGYLVNENGDMTSATGYTKDTNRGVFTTVSPSVGMAGSGTTAGAAGANILANNATWTFNTTDARLGTKLLGGSTYATSDTKFIIVDGAGTDTQKVEVYNGIEELLKGGSTVTISGANTLTATGDAYLKEHAAAPDTASRHFNEQMYYTSSPLSYASVDGTNPTKVDTIIIPKDAVSWTGGSNLYFVGNPAQDSEITQGVNTFHLYTMYENGEEVQRWLINDPTEAGAGETDHALVKDSFYVLVDTGLKTPMGDTVYRAHDDGTSGDGIIKASASWKSDTGITELKVAGRPGIIGNNCHPILNRVEYNAATYASQTAKIGTDVSSTGVADNNAGYAIFNVAGAKVVNLNAKNVGAARIWPNIADLGTLNEASSTSEVYNTTGHFPMVSIQTSPSDPLTVTVIYVNWDQSTMG